jgi:hypothetical protein
MLELNQYQQEQIAKFQQELSDHINNEDVDFDYNIGEVVYVIDLDDSVTIHIGESEVIYLATLELESNRFLIESFESYGEALYFLRNGVR